MAKACDINNTFCNYWIIKIQVIKNSLIYTYVEAHYVSFILCYCILTLRIKIAIIITVQKGTWLFSLHCSQSKGVCGISRGIMRVRDDCSVCGSWVLQKSNRPPTSPLSPSLCQHTTSAKLTCSEAISSGCIRPASSNPSLNNQWVYSRSSSLQSTTHYLDR